MLCNIAPVNLFGRDLFSNLKGPVHFASSGGLTLKFPDQPEPDYLCSLQSVLDIKEEVQQKFSNLVEMPANLGTTSDSVNIRRIKKCKPIKIQIDVAKPLPRFPQQLLKPAVIQGLTPIVEDLISREVVIAVLVPAACQSCLVGNLAGWRFVQDLGAVNQNSYSLFSCCSKPSHPSVTRFN